MGSITPREGHCSSLQSGRRRAGHVNHPGRQPLGTGSLSGVNITLFKETLGFQTTSYLDSNHAPFQKPFQEKHQFNF